MRCGVPFTILESFTRGKKGDSSLSEDRLFHSTHYTAVIDGATSKHPGLLAGGTPGKVIAEVICDAFSEMPPGIEMAAALSFLNTKIQIDERLKQNTDTDKTTDRPTASLLVFSSVKEEVWSIGDCLLSLDGEVYSFSTEMDKVASDFRSALNCLSLLKGKTIKDLKEKDTGRDVIMALLQEQTLFQNNKAAGRWGYGAIDGSPDALSFAKCFDVSGAHEIILASDGYPVLKASLQETEEALQKVLQDDPLLIGKFVSTKGLQEGCESFDDRSYIRLVRNL